MLVIRKAVDCCETCQNKRFVAYANLFVCDENPDAGSDMVQKMDFVVLRTVTKIKVVELVK